MSFILEALKKSETERRRGVSPDLHSVAATGRPGGRRRWSLLLSLALLVNAACLLWWLHPWQRVPGVNEMPAGNVPKPLAAAPPRSAAPPPVAADPDHAPQRAVELPRKPPALTAPAGWSDLPVVPAAKAPAAKAPAVKPPVRSKPAAQDLPLLQELPAAIRSELPEITISLHYYTADPASRMVRLNGLILREGQAVTDRLVMEKITPSGVVFRFGDTRFRMQAAF